MNSSKTILHPFTLYLMEPFRYKLAHNSPLLISRPEWILRANSCISIGEIKLHEASSTGRHPLLEPRFKDGAIFSMKHRLASDAPLPPKLQLKASYKQFSKPDYEIGK